MLVSTIFSYCDRQHGQNRAVTCYTNRFCSQSNLNWKMDIWYFIVVLYAINFSTWTYSPSCSLWATFYGQMILWSYRKVLFCNFNWEICRTFIEQTLALSFSLSWCRLTQCLKEFILSHIWLWRAFYWSLFLNIKWKVATVRSLLCIQWSAIIMLSNITRYCIHHYRNRSIHNDLLPVCQQAVM